MDSPSRGRPVTRQTTRITTVQSPSPPRNFNEFETEFKVHSLVGIPEVSYSEYCKQRFQLIEVYHSNIKELQKFFNEKVTEEYWKFELQHLQLTAQRDFNTKVNEWKETSEKSSETSNKKPKTATVSTQTEEEDELPVLQAVAVPQPGTSTMRRSSGMIFRTIHLQPKVPLQESPPMQLG